MTAVLVAIAGAIGAPARFLLDGWVQRRADATVPIGTLVVNLSGAFFLGLITGVFHAGNLSLHTQQIVGSGLLGAYTTFSTVTFESVQLMENAEWRTLSIYLVTTVLGGLCAAAVGFGVASVINSIV